MTLIKRNNYTTKFLMDFPEMREFFDLDANENTQEVQYTSDTYVDMDDYELQQQLY